MADNQNRATDETVARPANGGFVAAIVNGASRVWNAATEDGFLAAAWRQGIKELGVALKAFPDSISIDEPGTMYSPTQGEIADARESPSMGERNMWPSEMAKQNQNQPVKDNGNGNDYEAGHSM